MNEQPYEPTVKDALGICDLLAEDVTGQRDALQIAFDNIGELYKLVAQLRAELEEVRAKGSRIGWQRESAPA